MISGKLFLCINSCINADCGYSLHYFSSDIIQSNKNVIETMRPSEDDIDLLTLQDNEVV